MKRTLLKTLLLGILCMASLSSWADDMSDCLCFTAEEEGSTVKLSKNGYPPEVSLQTSSNGTSWSDYGFGTEIMLARVGDKVYFRNAADDVTGFSTTSWDWYQFSLSGKISASGNVMSLVDKRCTATTIPNDYCFYRLFYECSALITAPTLPATTLAEGCYSSMFYKCTNLTTAPELPTTTLAEGCYNGMFSGCTNLTTAPELPATTLAEGCYSSMFYKCTNLTTAPELPTTTLAEGCYNGMFSGCTNLTTAPELPATTLASSCYSGMFYGCKALTTAPELPATTLASSCYSSMFSECTNLTTAPELPATTMAYGCYSYMFKGCTNLTTVPELPATTMAESCYSYMFVSCTALTTAPELPATTLASSCYSSMFYGCSALTTAPELPATTLASSCYSSMFNGCTNLTTVPELPATTLAEGCYNGMFYGCTNLTTSLEISSVGWASLYENLPLKVPEGVEVYYASAISGSTITFTQIPAGTVMAPGTAVIVKGTGTVLFPVSGEEGTSYPTNYLTGTTVNKAYDKDTDPVVYTLSGVNPEGKLLFTKYTGTTLGAHKAYLPASALPNGSEAKDFTFVFEDGTSTHIAAVPACSPAHGKMYNLNGVPVNEHYKGIVIKNGKKMWSK